jgi:small-conductance mechanosensitive channel
MTENLMCSGAREWLCWNSIGFPGSLAVQRLVKAISTELYRLEGFDTQFRSLVVQAGQEGGATLTNRWDDLRRKEEMQARKKNNLAAAIAEYGPSPMFQQQLAEIASIDRELARERRQLETWQNRTVQLPESVSELHRMLEEKYQTLAQDSPEFGNLMRQRYRSSTSTWYGCVTGGTCCHEPR